MRTIEEIRNFFRGDVYAAETTGIVIEEAGPGHAIVSLVPDARHMNAENMIMGAVYFTMADYAFAVASNHEFDTSLTVTLSSNIEFLSVPKGKKLFAEANVDKEGRKTSFYDIRVTDDKGTLVARVTSTGYRVK
jgi:acyl-CoA thioesterase